MDIKEIALKVAEESGAVCYSPAPFLRAVRGYGLTYEQLQNFAEALIESYKAELLKEVEEPVAWRADVATDFGIEDRYSGWETWLINYEPNCPLGSVRNKTGLFTSDQVAAAVLKATKPLEEEIERLKKHQCAPVCIFHEGDEREELKKQLAAAQDQVAAMEERLERQRSYFDAHHNILMDEIETAEQRVAEAICELLESQHTWLTKEAASALIRHKFVKDV